MITDTQDQAAIERRLWKALEDHQTGMLGIDGAPKQTQPMTAFLDEERNQIWFFTRSDTELSRAIGEGRRASFIVQRKGLQAVISGELTLQYDPARIERYWNAVVAAWYPLGREDPGLTMLCLTCEAAQVWLSDAGPVRFAWEIAKAHATHAPPELGGRANLSFH